MPKKAPRATGKKAPLATGFFASIPLDWDALRALTPDGQDQFLRDYLAQYPDLGAKLDQAVAHWHFPTRRLVLAEFQESFPDAGLTDKDVQAILDCYQRVKT